MRFGSLFAMALVLALTACMTAQAPPAQEDGGPSESGTPQPTLAIAVRGEPPTIAAKRLVSFSGSLNTVWPLFNATLDFVDEHGLPQPYLVEGLPQLDTDSWRVFPDGRMETTHALKANLTWHDGAPLSAEDFVFAWRVYATPDLGQATTQPIGAISEVVALDARTVVIRWSRPYPEADQMVNDFQALPRHILEDSLGLDPLSFIGLPFWSWEYVGLGPYRVAAWEPGAFIIGEAFDGHALGRPNIDRIEVSFIPDVQTGVANILAKEVHYISDFFIEAAEGQVLEQQWAQNNAGVVLWSPSILRHSRVQQRPEIVENPALLDVRVRRALAHAMDKETAVEVLTGGKGVVAHAVTYPREAFYPEVERAVPKYSYDPRRAQELMEEAGFMRRPDGLFTGRDGQPITFSLASSTGAIYESEATVFADNLRQAGFDAYPRVAAAEMREEELRAKLPGLQLGAGSAFSSFTSEQVGRPENRWRGTNRGGWSNPQYDRLFETYEAALGDAERARTTAELERVRSEELPSILHYFTVSANPHVAELQGPVVRQVPGGTNLGPFLHVQNWKWRS